MTAKEKRKSKKDLKKALKKAKALEKKANGFWADFKKFVAKGNVIDLAVAVVVSAAFNKLLNSIVSNVFNPIISAIVPHKDLSDWKIVLVKAVEADEKEGIAAVEEVAVRIGLVIQALIEFLIIALSLFLVIRVLMNIKNALRAKERKASEEKARLAAEKKRQEEKEAAEREERIRREFINDVAVQADVLTDIKEILLRMEENSKKQ
ncbi:MAG: large conductance mechanosensitive channel protein MscL [Clostridia bacterium]|nr:large conductance mechanosensitive channel protein MscL [Clostridia bacterium]